MLEQLTADWQKLENKVRVHVILIIKVRFITEIIKGTLIVSNRKKPDLLAELKKRGYTAFFKGKVVGSTVQSDKNQEDEEASGSQGYDYLFSMSIWYILAQTCVLLYQKGI